MYGKKIFSQEIKILIVKTSSIGDILQAFYLVPFLKKIYPKCTLHWVVEKKWESLITSHPLIDQAIAIEKKKLSSFLVLLKHKYDVVFDLQGNTKSALMTFLARAPYKVGFGKSTVRERPNLWVTNVHFDTQQDKNIRTQYLEMITSFFLPEKQEIPGNIAFLLQEKECLQVEEILTKVPIGKKALFIAPWGAWPNKQLDFSQLMSFLQKVEKEYPVFFLLVWGSEEEKKKAESLHQALFFKSTLLPKLSFSSLQFLMQKIDGVLASDSSLLHLCGMTQTPSFSFFGPTKPEVFIPLGNHHQAFTGKCPYKVSFMKQCPFLRSCKTGACLKSLETNELFLSFSKWADFYLKKSLKE